RRLYYVVRLLARAPHSVLHSFPTRRSSDLVSSLTSRTSPSGMLSSRSRTPPGGSQCELSRRRMASTRPSLFTIAAATLTECIGVDRKSTRLNSSHLGISYAVFCLKKKTDHN